MSLYCRALLSPINTHEGWLIVFKSALGEVFMSRIVSAEELNLIEQIISEHIEGIGISALEKALLRWQDKNGHFLKSGLVPHTEVFNGKKKEIHTGIQGVRS